MKRVVLLSALSLWACKPPGSDGEVTKDTSKPLPWSFRYGLNMGHRNANWGDDKDATLGSRASAQHSREAIESLWLLERVTRTRLSPTEALWGARRCLVWDGRTRVRCTTS